MLDWEDNYTGAWFLLGTARWVWHMGKKVGRIPN
jgi:hypothetical protein